MTYNVFGGTLNLAQLQLNYLVWIWITVADSKTIMQFPTKNLIIHLPIHWCMIRE